MVDTLSGFADLNQDAAGICQTLSVALLFDAVTAMKGDVVDPTPGGGDAGVDGGATDGGGDASAGDAGGDASTSDGGGDASTADGSAGDASTADGSAGDAAADAS